MVLSGLTRERVKPTTPERKLWRRLGAHLGAGLRLRRELETRQAVELTGEAVLDPAGRVLDAEGPAQARDAREALHDAVRRIDRARTQQERADSARAIELWQGLVDGQWSLVDRFDSDGRRFLVARRNEIGLRDPRRLTSRERDVAYLCCLGRSNKAIAYTLGISPASVSAHQKRLLRKLGLSTLTELQALSLHLPDFSRSRRSD